MSSRHAPAARPSSWLAALLVVTALMNAFPDAARAGATFEYAFCTSLPDGSGYCEGNFLGFRNDPDPSVYISFVKHPNGKRQMEAYYNHEKYGCYAEGAKVVAMFDEMMTQRDAFSIQWDASGACTQIGIFHGSKYSEY